jgi:hypothetical protein
MESSLEMAARHVREAEEKVAHQEHILRELQTHGHDTMQAERLLVNFREILQLARKHLALEQVEKRNASEER